MIIAAAGLLGSTTICGQERAGRETTLQKRTKDALQRDLRVREDPDSGQIEVFEGDQPVLRYNYQSVPLPAGYLKKVGAAARKYAVPRSNYIHPLYDC
jgi:hypothetical protein